MKAFVPGLRVEGELFFHDEDRDSDGRGGQYETLNA